MAKRSAPDVSLVHLRVLPWRRTVHSDRLRCDLGRSTAGYTVSSDRAQVGCSECLDVDARVRAREALAGPTREQQLEAALRASVDDNEKLRGEIKAARKATAYVQKRFDEKRAEWLDEIQWKAEASRASARLETALRVLLTRMPHCLKSIYPASEADEATPCGRIALYQDAAPYNTEYRCEEHRESLDEVGWADAARAALALLDGGR